MKRPWRDAPQWVRCKAAIRLADGSYAQCGRWRNPGTEKRRDNTANLCTQHFNMAMDGKPVREFLDGYPLLVQEKP